MVGRYTFCNTVQNGCRVVDATPPAAATIDAAAAAAKQRVAPVIHCVPLQPKRRRRLLVVVLRLGKAAEYGDEHVCLSVSLCLQ